MRLRLSDSQLVDEPHAGAVWEVRNLKAIGTAQHTAVVTCKCNATLPDLHQIVSSDLPPQKATSCAHRRTVFSLGAVTGNPDGMTIDADGNLWIACWGGSQIIRVDPKTGALLRMIKIPVTRVTSVTWGGPMLDTLYVTTMRLGLSDSQLVDEPHAGAVWEVRNLKAIGTAQHTAVVTCKCNATLPSTSTLP
ncbi:regucalcin-like [Macrosteles quadrilineatus]|uniref:regucalcin-like n=1 Tax=Macrosteles quadrilineatus TaxID=74068 RepID=UPI0023E2D425|nr:regucalcin-like [Macrosteles quadrilineatus]